MNHSEKPVMLCIHGLDSDQRIWSSWRDHYSGSYTVYTPDLPGHGSSSSQPLLAFSDLAQSLAKQVSFNANTQIVLVGHSLGAIIAVEIIRQQLLPVSKLVLLAPAGIEVFRQHEKALVLSGISQSYFTGKMLQAYLADSSGKTGSSASLDVLLYYAVRIMEYHILDIELSIPTLIFYGEEDELIPNVHLHKEMTRQELLKMTVKHWPGSKAYIIRSADHFLPLSGNKSIYSLSDSFLASAP